MKLELSHDGLTKTSAWFMERLSITEANGYGGKKFTFFNWQKSAGRCIMLPYTEAEKFRIVEK